jgi:hypothetical protein
LPKPARGKKRARKTAAQKSIIAVPPLAKRILLPRPMKRLVFYAGTATSYLNVDFSGVEEKHFAESVFPGPSRRRAA